MTLQPHSPAWYDRLATMQAGYCFPWRSQLAPDNGEDTYLRLVHEHLRPDSDVLDVGCGHGDVPLEIAPFVHHVLAYDRVPSYIEMAQTAAAERAIPNVTFLCYDSSTAAHPSPHIPAEDNRFDLLISRRGPLHWLEDARRVARPGAVIIQLNPMHSPPPTWNEQLPDPLRRPLPGEWTMRGAVEQRLALGRLALHSCWTFEVPQYFPDAEQLYLYLSWGYTAEEVPPFAGVRPLLEDIFARHATAGGLPLRHSRLLWKAIVE
jgi:SAM-dependent methyltransferase